MVPGVIVVFKKVYSRKRLGFKSRGDGLITREAFGSEEPNGGFEYDISFDEGRGISFG